MRPNSNKPKDPKQILANNLKIARETRPNPDGIHPKFIVHNRYRIHFSEKDFGDEWSSCLPLVLFLPSTHTISEMEIRAMMLFFTRQYEQTQEFMEKLLTKDGTKEGSHNLDYVQEEFQELWGTHIQSLLQLCIQNPELHHLFEISETFGDDVAKGINNFTHSIKLT